MPFSVGERDGRVALLELSVGTRRQVGNAVYTSWRAICTVLRVCGHAEDLQAHTNGHAHKYKLRLCVFTCILLYTRM
jgi:hypothetical protein